MRTPVKELIRSEENHIKRMTSLIDEIGFHLGVLFAEDKLEVKHFELSEGETGWIYAMLLEDNDAAFSGVVPYGTVLERMVLDIYEDVWNHEIPPVVKRRPSGLTQEERDEVYARTI